MSASASSTSSELSDAALAAAGVGPGLVRMSVGITGALEDRWRALGGRLAAAGIATLLPWGSAAEEARSRRIAAGVAGAIVPPRQSLPELAALARRADVVAGVDTGLTHLAAALGTPTVAVFTATDAAQAGVARTGPHAQDLGGRGHVPTFDEVAAAVGRALATAPRC